MRFRVTLTRRLPVAPNAFLQLKPDPTVNACKPCYTALGDKLRFF